MFDGFKQFEKSIAEGRVSRSRADAAEAGAKKADFYLPEGTFLNGSMSYDAWRNG